MLNFFNFAYLKSFRYFSNYLKLFEYFYSYSKELKEALTNVINNYDINAEAPELALIKLYFIYMKYRHLLDGQWDLEALLQDLDGLVNTLSVYF